MEAKIYNQIGKSVGTISLPEEIFGARWNADLVHQVIVSEAANARTLVAHVKGRGEVRGGGKKPWKQKGTGRARHGSSRSPIWIGGEITHGPNSEKIYARKINKKMKAQALFAVLSQKWKDGEMIFVDDFTMKDAKTKEAKEVLKSLSGVESREGIVTKRKNAALFALGKKDKAVERSFANIKSIETGELRNITPATVLKYKYLVISRPAEAIAFISSKMK